MVSGPACLCHPPAEMDFRRMYLYAWLFYESSRDQTQVLVLVIKHFIHQAIFPVQLNISRRILRKCLTPDSGLFGSVSAKSRFPLRPLSTSWSFVTSHFGWICWRKSFRIGHLQEGDDARNPGARCLWRHCCHGHRQLQHHQSLTVFSFGEGHGILVHRAEFSTCRSS